MNPHPDQVRDDDESKATLSSRLDPLRPQEKAIWAVYPQRRHLLPEVRLPIDKLCEELPGGVAAEWGRLGPNYRPASFAATTIVRMSMIALNVAQNQKRIGFSVRCPAR